MKLNCLIRNKLEYPIHDTICWTDSTVVLQYIRSESRRFHTFVANRVATIHDESTPRQWRHVDTCENPTEIASRGAKSSEPRKLELWLHSPNFLLKEEENWPGKPFQLPELPQDDSKMLEPLLSHYSSRGSLLKSRSLVGTFQEVFGWPL